jgi:hypothetical protein
LVGGKYKPGCDPYACCHMFVYDQEITRGDLTLMIHYNIRYRENTKIEYVDHMLFY